MSGGNEGENVGADFDFTQSLAGLRVFRLQKKREQIPRHVVGALFQMPATGQDYSIDCLIENLQRSASLKTSKTRHRSRQAEHVERIDLSDRFKVVFHSFANVFWILAQASGKNGALKHVQTDARDLDGEVNLLSAQTVQALNRALRRSNHRGRKAADCFWHKQRR